MLLLSDHSLSRVCDDVTHKVVWEFWVCGGVFGLKYLAKKLIPEEMSGRTAGIGAGNQRIS